MSRRERLSGYLLKKKGDCYFTNCEKWQTFSNKTKHYDAIEAVKAAQRATRAKTSIVEVYDVYEGSNGITRYIREERIFNTKEK